MEGLTVLLDDLDFPEMPRWHDGDLWFVHGGTVATLRADGTTTQWPSVPGALKLGLEFLPDGGVLIVSALDRVIHRLDPKGSVSVFADLSEHVETPLNEILRAPGGSLYVGGMGFLPTGGEEPRPTRMLRISPSGAVTREGPELLFPNGLALTADGRTLIVAESFGARITAIDVGADGVLGAGRTFADLGASLDGSPGQPDGLTLDSSGAVWYADLDGGHVARVLDGGRETHRIEMPFAHVSACAFGATEQTLYCTALRHLPFDGRPAGGALCRLDLTVFGVG